jgi:hypothetical protein
MEKRIKYLKDTRIMVKNSLIETQKAINSFYIVSEREELIELGKINEIMGSLYEEFIRNSRIIINKFK